VDAREAARWRLAFAAYAILAACIVADFVDNQLWGNRWEIPGIVTAVATGATSWAFGFDLLRRNRGGGKTE
jgi:branched-subunit amino acid transport protein